MSNRLCSTMLTAIVMGLTASAGGAEPDLTGHWKLTGDTQDHSGAGNHGVNHLVNLNAAGPNGRLGGAAEFDGRTSCIEVPDSPSLQTGSGAFSLSMHVYTDQESDDVLGDLISRFDPVSRTGFNLSIQNYAGVTSAQSNYRHLHFGIDAGRIDREWTDCGRPGNNLFVYALCVYQGELYAGTFEHGKDEAGHVYRYASGTSWIDCGSPDRCNAVQSLAVYDGRLYAGVSRYLASGSALPESPNEAPGGRVYRCESPGAWLDCGKLENPETGESFTVGGMTVFRGELYAGVSKPPGRGLYRYNGAQEWEYLGNPGRRIINPVVYNGSLYTCSLDGGAIARYDGGRSWTDVGKPLGVTQTYGFAVHQGILFASSWPNGEVFRYDGDRSWLSTGPLGQEKESMGMMVYNGKLYAGTLPLAAVYRYDGDNKWFRTGLLDKTPDVRYRRAWSMAVFQGKLFCGTLPSGHVFSIEAGKSVTWDHALPAGWVHLAAVRTADRLRLYVDGKPVASSAPFVADDYNVDNNEPLRIGFGAHDYFHGRLTDVRLVRRALTDREVVDLADR